MRNRDALNPPERTAEDAGHAMAKAVVAATLPGGGDLFSWLVVPPLEARRQAWMDEVASRICELERRGGCDLAELSKDEGFIDIVLHATQAALRTRDGEKRDALRNAIINYATAPSADGPLREVLIGLIDELTPAHLRALKLIDDPDSWASIHGRTWPRGMFLRPASFLQQAFPELNAVEPLAGEIWRALLVRGLVGPEGTMFEVLSGSVGGRTTELGRALLRFIAEPQ